MKLRHKELGHIARAKLTFHDAFGFVLRLQDLDSKSKIQDVMPVSAGLSMRGQSEIWEVVWATEMERGALTLLGFYEPS